MVSVLQNEDLHPCLRFCCPESRAWPKITRLARIVTARGGCLFVMVRIAETNGLMVLPGRLVPLCMCLFEVGNLVYNEKDVSVQSPSSEGCFVYIIYWHTRKH